MEQFEELVAQLQEAGRRQTPCSPGFTARTMARLDAIRPFTIQAESAPAQRTPWRTWQVAAAAAAVVLVALAAWAIPHVLHRQGRVEMAPANSVASDKNQVVSGELDGKRSDEPVRTSETPSATPSSPPTAGTDSSLSVPPMPPPESAGSVPNTHYAPDPSFIQPDQRQQAPIKEHVQ